MVNPISPLLYRWTIDGYVLDGRLCDELEERSACEMTIHALFGFLTQQVVLFTYRTCTYIGKIDNARHSSVAVTEEKGYRDSRNFAVMTLAVDF
jgi:hypothetical protein